MAAGAARAAAPVPSRGELDSGRAGGALRRAAPDTMWSFTSAILIDERGKGT